MNNELSYARRFGSKSGEDSHCCRAGRLLNMQTEMLQHGAEERVDILQGIAFCIFAGYFAQIRQ